jgi:hypothetical protein
MSTIIDIEKGEADLLAYCEDAHGFPIGVDADSKQPWKSPAGPGYVVITSKDFSPTFEAVKTAAQDAFDEYVKDKTGKLYWRKRPELSHNSRGWRFYMRLVVA